MFYRKKIFRTALSQQRVDCIVLDRGSFLLIVGSRPGTTVSFEGIGCHLQGTRPQSAGNGQVAHIATSFLSPLLRQPTATDAMLGLSTSNTRDQCTLVCRRIGPSLGVPGTGMPLRDGPGSR